MNLFFIGALYSPEDEKRVLKQSKVGIQSSANNYQWGIISGLFKNMQQKLTVVNSVPMGSFPKYCNIFIEHKHQYECDTAEILSAGYVNLPVIKQFQRGRHLFKRLKWFLKTSERSTVILYSLYNPYLKVLKKLKLKGYQFNYFLIITDLPGEFGVKNTNRLIGKIKDCIGKQNLNLAKYADGYVLLTEKMKDAVGIENKPYTIIEGISGYEAEDLLPINQKTGEPYILYTGALDKQFGLDMLIAAFKLLPKGSAKLVIAGSGDYEKELIKECEINENIKYLGYIGKEEVQKLQNGAAILVNPRSPKEEYTAYSFPSKTMEYLVSGTPVVMYALPGMPEEYIEHLFVPKDDSIQTLANTFSDILSMDNDSINKHCENARQFILKQKNSKVQTEKIIDLIDRLNAAEKL